MAERVRLGQEWLRFVLIGAEHAQRVADARIGHREFLIEKRGELEELDASSFLNALARLTPIE
jgi:hypothetical protein